jgi:hypothetical protein
MFLNNCRPNYILQFNLNQYRRQKSSFIAINILNTYELSIRLDV